MSNKDTKEFDERGNLIHFKDSSGYEYWQEFDKNNNEIHYKDSDGSEYWYKYDENNIPIDITQQELYLNIKRSNRFEIIDI